MCNMFVNASPSLWYVRDVEFGNETMSRELLVKMKLLGY